MADLAHNHIIPTAIKYQNKLIENANGLKDLKLDNKHVKQSIDMVSTHLKVVMTEVEKMIEARRKANKIEDVRKKAIAYCDDVKGSYFDKIRYAVDHLELLIDDEDWPLPKYREMLFIK
jgi:glutamine synthetase